MLRLYYVLTFIVLSAFFINCKDKKNDETITIAFSQCVGSDAWRRNMLEEMKRELSLNKNINFVYRDANNNSFTQIQQLRDIAKSKPDLIIISPNEAAPLTPIVDSLFESGIPVIVTDRKTTSNKYSAFVGADNYKIGYKAGEYLGAKLNGEGNILQITGLPLSSASQEREKGFKDALQAFKHIDHSTKINGQWIKENAEKVLVAHLYPSKRYDAIFAFNDQMALAAYQVNTQLNINRNIQIIGVDALPGPNNGIDLIYNKKINASLLYPTGGKECIQTAMAILSGKVYEKELLLESFVVDSTNVHAMKVQNDKLITQQIDIDRQQQLLEDQKRVFIGQQRILNFLVISLVLAIVFGGITFYLLKANWDKNKQLENQNHEILNQQAKILEMSENIKTASEAKINFFTMISHEFKTPLTLMLIPLRSFLKKYNLTDDQKYHIELVEKNALVLQQLINQLLDFQKFKNYKVSLNAESKNILLICQQIVNLFRPLARIKNIDFYLENNMKLPVADIDKSQFEKLIFNLLSNAFKFTPNNGKITLSLTNAENNESFKVIISDNGTGISDHDIKNIFEPFYHGSNVEQGSGIGLALCKEIVSLHNGSIDVESNPEHCTSFSIVLPFKQKNIILKTEEKSSIDPEYLSNNFLLEDCLQDIDIQHRPTQKKWDRREQSILIIEDNRDLSILLKKIFAESYEIHIEHTGLAALDMVDQINPTLIITDNMLPDISGIEVVSRLKSDKSTSFIPVIILSAKSNDEHIIDGLKVKADLYVTKPFNEEYLIESVKSLIDNRKKLEEYYSTNNIDLRHLVHVDPNDKNLLKKLEEFVDNNISNPQLSVDEISSFLNISKVTLHRKLKALLDCNVSFYVNEKKLQKSKQLILKNIPLNIVAYESGFTNPAYFSTAFKKKYGMTPSEFKTNIKRNFKI